MDLIVLAEESLKGFEQRRGQVRISASESEPGSIYGEAWAWENLVTEAVNVSEVMWETPDSVSGRNKKRGFMSPGLKVWPCCSRGV